MGYVGKVTIGSSTHLVGSTLYGTCATAAATAEKVVTCADFDQLLTGVTIHVKFTYSNTATSPTLNVNSTGAKPLYKYGTTVPSNIINYAWKAGSVVSVTYDGSNWIMNGFMDDNLVNQMKASSASNHQQPILTGTRGVDASTAVSQTLFGSKASVNPYTGDLLANTYNGYTLGAACEKSLGSVASGNTGLVTGGDVYTAIAAATTGANMFKGSLGSSTSTATYTQSTLEAASYKAGWYLVVNSAGTYVGHACEVGDMVYCVSDKGSAYAASDFTVVQNEMDVLTNTEIDAIVNS